MTENNQLKRPLQMGDVVALKSSDTLMTVAGFASPANGPEVAKCLWHDENGVLHREDFEIDTLNPLWDEPEDGDDEPEA